MARLDHQLGVEWFHWLLWPQCRGKLENFKCKLVTYYFSFVLHYNVTFIIRCVLHGRYVPLAINPVSVDDSRSEDNSIQ
jgi:hypothetical protein